MLEDKPNMEEAATYYSRSFGSLKRFFSLQEINETRGVQIMSNNNEIFHPQVWREKNNNNNNIQYDMTRNLTCQHR